MCKHLYNIIAFIILIALSFSLYGCSSSGSCNQSFGSDAAQPVGPIPDPHDDQIEPRETVKSNIIIQVRYDDGEPIAGVLVTSNITGLIPAGSFTDATGNISMLPVDLPEGTVITLDFYKDGHVIYSVEVTIGPDGELQPDGSILYHAEALGYVPFAPDIQIRASSLYYPAFMFGWCNGIVASHDGRYLYLAYDGTHRKIVRVELTSADGTQIPQTRTLVTFPQGGSSSANIPFSLEISPDNKTLYASVGRTLVTLDVGNVPLTEELTPTVIAGAPGNYARVDEVGTNARFGVIQGLAINTEGNVLYISDSTCIRRMNLTTKAVTTIVGNLSTAGTTVGTGDVALLTSANGLALTKDGTTLYAVDNNGTANLKRVIKITLGADAASSTVSQFGTTSGFRWMFPSVGNNDGCDLALSQDENTLYVAASSAYIIRAVALDKHDPPASTDITTFIGSGTSAYLDAKGTEANIQGAYGLAFSNDYNTLYFIDGCPHRLRAVDMVTKDVTTLMGGRCGSRDGDVAALLPPKNLAISNDGDTIYFSVNDDYMREYYIAKFIQSTGTFERIAGDGTRDTYLDNPNGLKAKFRKPQGVALLEDKNILYVADTRNYRIRSIDLTTNAVTTFMGNGTNAIDDNNKTFGFINALTISRDGQYLFTAEEDVETTLTQSPTQSVIRMIDIESETITTIAGGARGHVNAIGNSAQFYSIIAMDASPNGDYLYFTDVANINNIPYSTNPATVYDEPNTTDERYVNSLSLTNYYVNTIAGGVNGFRNPTGITTSEDGKFLFISDWFAIKAVTVETGVVKLMAGSETEIGCEDMIGAEARFGNRGNGMRIGIFDLKLSPDGRAIFVADNGNAMIRKVMTIRP